jgi:hypothetical protein
MAEISLSSYNTMSYMVCYLLAGQSAICAAIRILPHAEASNQRFADTEEEKAVFLPVALRLCVRTIQVGRFVLRSLSGRMDG